MLYILIPFFLNIKVKLEKNRFCIKLFHLSFSYKLHGFCSFNNNDIGCVGNAYSGGSEGDLLLNSSAKTIFFFE